MSDLYHKMVPFCCVQYYINATQYCNTKLVLIAKIVVSIVLKLCDN